MVKYSPATLNRTFAALADPTRRRILAHLARGDRRVTELARPHAMSLPAVSKHLRVLEKAGLLRRRRYGRVHEMRLNAEPLKKPRNGSKNIESSGKGRSIVWRTIWRKPSRLKRKENSDVSLVHGQCSPAGGERDFRRRCDCGCREQNFKTKTETTNKGRAT